MRTSPAATSGPPAQVPADGEGLCTLLRVLVGRQMLALPIDAVREILQVRPFTPLPHTPAFVHGLMNLRGAVVPVIDLAARLGDGTATVGARSCVIVAELAPADEDAAPEAFVAGLLVDSVLELFDVQARAIGPVPTLGTRVDRGFLAGMTQAHGEIVPVLQLETVLEAGALRELIGRHGRH